MNELSIYNEDLKAQIDSANKRQLEQIAETAVQNIVTIVHDVHLNLEEAKELIDDANCVKGDWYATEFLFFKIGESEADKRSKLNTRAIGLQNKATYQQQQIIQETIKLTLISKALSDIIVRKLEQIVKDGFKECEGRMIMLEKKHREQINDLRHILTKKKGSKKTIIISIICGMLITFVVLAMLDLI